MIHKPHFWVYKESQEGSWKDISTPMFLAAAFTIAKRWRQPNGPIDEYVDKQVWAMHLMEYYSVFKRKEIL